MQDYFDQNERAYLSFKQCESPMEEELLNCLLKFYNPHEILAQHNVGGSRFRLDFFTEDGIGWEIDGKGYHDAEKDQGRDAWILANTEVRQIIRIEAAAFHWFRDACIAVLSHFVQRMEKGRGHCTFDLITTWSEAEYWLKAIEKGEFGEADMHQAFEQAEAYFVAGNTGYVGGPFAFIDLGHELWYYIPEERHNLNQWEGRISNRVA